MKIAVIGAGYWGKNLVRNFDALGALATVCENNRETLEAIAKAYPQADKSDSFEAVLNDPSIEALAIASPAEMHYKMVKQGLLADKHVFVEKPLALHEEEGIELHELAGERKKILMVFLFGWKTRACPFCILRIPYSFTRSFKKEVTYVFRSNQGSVAEYKSKEARRKFAINGWLSGCVAA